MAEQECGLLSPEGMQSMSAACLCGLWRIPWISQRHIPSLRLIRFFSPEHFLVFTGNKSARFTDGLETCFPSPALIRDLLLSHTAACDEVPKKENGAGKAKGKIRGQLAKNSKVLLSTPLFIQL